MKCKHNTPCNIPTLKYLSIIGNGKHSVVYKYIGSRLYGTKDRTKDDKVIYAVKKILKQNQHIYYRELEYGKRIKSEYFPLVDSKYECPMCGNMNILMEFIDGYTLEKINKMKVKLPIHVIKKITFQLLKALQYLEDKQILHNDIKPSNIILTKDGNIKIIDFGMMKEYFLPGTNLYKDPFTKQMPTKKFTNSSDVWSLGRTIYEIIQQTDTKDIVSIKSHNKLKYIGPVGQTDNFRIPNDKIKHINKFLENCLNDEPHKRSPINRLLEIVNDF